MRDVDREEKIAESFLAPVGSEFPSPDTRVIARDGWYQTITPSTGSTMGNEVVVSRLSADEADAAIEQTLAEYRALGLPFKWCVGPLTEPADFGARLAARGFVPGAVRGMAIDPRSWTPTPRAGISIERVEEGGFLEYLECFERGWDMPVADREAWIGVHERANAAGRFHFFVARVAGEAVGTAGYIVKPRSIYLVGGNVLPVHRGKGVYRALLDARLTRAAEAGITLATTQARETTSAPILEAFGFESLYRAEIYRWRP